MIDPINMTQYGLSIRNLEETVLFACCVAGKNAVTTAKALDKFLTIIHQEVWSYWKPGYFYSPFLALRLFYGLHGGRARVAEIMKLCGLGCYNNRARTFEDLINRTIDLQTCTPQQLEEVWGIAEKTSRFFILHTRPDVRYAALDTHIRKHMTALGIKFPKGQPKGKRYLQLEQKFLKLADASGMTVAEFDLYLWNMHAGHKAKKAA